MNIMCAATYFIPISGYYSPKLFFMIKSDLQMDDNRICALGDAFSVCFFLKNGSDDYV